MDIKLIFIGQISIIIIIIIIIQPLQCPALKVWHVI